METLDWKRIRHLMKLGIFAALMVLAGDMLLGWGVHDASQPGLAGFLSAYLHLPDGALFWSAFLGLIGIPLEQVLRKRGVLTLVWIAGAAIVALLDICFFPQ